MAKARKSLTESHLAAPEAVGYIRHSVAGFAIESGILGEKLDSVRLAVSEAFINVVRHAYRNEPGQVHVTAHALPSEICVMVADDGCGYNVPARNPGLGLGMNFITDACDEFALIEQVDGGTEAQMIFRIH